MVIDYAFRLTKEQYNYLLPICRKKLLYVYNGITLKSGKVLDLYSFIGSKEEHIDIINRCKYLDEDLIEESLEYKERFLYNVNYNKGIYFKYVYS